MPLPFSSEIKNKKKCASQRLNIIRPLNESGLPIQAELLALC
jgi:hypothetical protein